MIKGYDNLNSIVDISRKKLWKNVKRRDLVRNKRQKKNEEIDINNEEKSITCIFKKSIKYYIKIELNIII